MKYRQINVVTFLIRITSESRVLSGCYIENRCTDCVLCVLCNHSPNLLVDFVVPRTPRCLWKLCFTAWRLQRKACVCWGGPISAHQSWCLRSLHWPWGQKAKLLSHCSTQGTRMSLQLSIVSPHQKEKTANCPVRNFGLHTNITHSLCPSFCLLIWKDLERLYGAAKFTWQNNE